MTLKELIEISDAGEWQISRRPDGSIEIHAAHGLPVCVMAYHPRQADANGALLVHAKNMLPKLVEALEEIERLTTTYSESSLSFGVVSKKAASVLAEANNPEVPQ